MAYLGAHVCTSKTQNVYFDTDAVEAVLDTGCSVTLSSERSDFILYKPTIGQVEGLGVHNIVSTGTVKYTVIDDNGKKVNLLIRDSIHVPTLDVRLISVQQLAQQNANSDAGGHVTADYLKLTWDNHVKTVPYHSNSNLPILLRYLEAKLPKHTFPDIYMPGMEHILLKMTNQSRGTQV